MVHVACWHEQLPGSPETTWQRSTDMLSRLLANDPDLLTATAKPAVPGRMHLSADDESKAGGSLGASGSETVMATGLGQPELRSPQLSLALDGSSCVVAWEGPAGDAVREAGMHACLLTTTLLGMQVRHPPHRKAWLVSRCDSGMHEFQTAYLISCLPVQM